MPALRLGAYQIFFHFQSVRMFLPLPSGCMGQDFIGLSADLLKGLSCSLGFTGQQKAQKKMRKTLTRIVNEGKGGIICILL